MAGAIDLYAGNVPIAGPNLFKINYNPLDQVQIDPANVFKNIPQVMLEELAAFLKKLVDSIIQLLLDVPGLIKDLEQMIVGAIKDITGIDLGPLLDTIFADLGALGGLLNDLANLLGLSGGLAGITSLLQEVANACITAGPGAGLAELLGALLGGIDLSTVWNAITNIANLLGLPDLATLQQDAATFLSNIENYISNFITNVLATNPAVDALQTLAQQIIDTLTGLSGGGIPDLQTWLDNLLAPLLTIINTLTGGSATTIGDAVTNLGDWVTNLLAFLGGINLSDPNFLANLETYVTNFVTNLVTNLQNLAGTDLATVQNWLVSLITNLTGQDLSDFQTWLQSLGADLTALIDAITGGSGGTLPDLTAWFNNLTAFLGGINFSDPNFLANITTYIENFVISLLQQISTTPTVLENLKGELVTAVQNAFGIDISGILATLGADLPGLNDLVTGLDTLIGVIGIGPAVAIIDLLPGLLSQVGGVTGLLNLFNQLPALCSTIGGAAGLQNLLDLLSQTGIDCSQPGLLQNIITWLTNNLGGIIGAVTSSVSPLTNPVGTLTNIWDQIVNAIVPASHIHIGTGGSPPELLNNPLFDGAVSIADQGVWVWDQAKAAALGVVGAVTVTANGIRQTLISNPIQVVDGQQITVSVGTAFQNVTAAAGTAVNNGITVLLKTYDTFANLLSEIPIGTIALPNGTSSLQNLAQTYITRTQDAWVALALDVGANCTAGTISFCNCSCTNQGAVLPQINTKNIFGIQGILDAEESLYTMLNHVMTGLVAFPDISTWWDTTLKQLTGGQHGVADFLSNAVDNTIAGLNATTQHVATALSMLYTSVNTSWTNLQNQIDQLFNLGGTTPPPTPPPPPGTFQASGVGAFQYTLPVTWDYLDVVMLGGGGGGNGAAVILPGNGGTSGGWAFITLHRTGAPVLPGRVATDITNVSGQVLNGGVGAGGNSGPYTQAGGNGGQSYLRYNTTAGLQTAGSSQGVGGGNSSRAGRGPGSTSFWGVPYAGGGDVEGPGEFAITGGFSAAGSPPGGGGCGGNPGAYPNGGAGAPGCVWIRAYTAATG